MSDEAKRLAEIREDAIGAVKTLQHHGWPTDSSPYVCAHEHIPFLLATIERPAAERDAAWQAGVEWMRDKCAAIATEEQRTQGNCQEWRDCAELIADEIAAIRDLKPTAG